MRLDKEPPGSAAFESGWRAAPAYVPRREQLRRTVPIALLAGIVLKTVNQLDVIVRGDATQLPDQLRHEFVVPFMVSAWGWSAGAASRARSA